MIVDDDRSVADGLKEILDRQLFHVCVAYTVEQALGELTRDFFDVVVIDWILPGGHGRQVVEFTDRYYPETAIVVNSAYPSTDAECTISGAHQFVEKGPSTEPVRNAVERGVRWAATRRMQLHAATCRTCAPDGWFLDAVRSFKALSPFWEGHLGLVSPPYGIPESLLLWLAGCHDQSSGPIQTLDCRSLPPSQIEETIFGRADLAPGRAPTLKRGLAEQARGGALCVRHIDRAEPETAVHLARAAGTGIVSRLGSDRELPANFRLVVTVETDQPKEQVIDRLPAELRDIISNAWLTVPRPGESGPSGDTLLQEMIRSRSGGRQSLGPAATWFVQHFGMEATLTDCKSAVERIHELGVPEKLAPEDLGVPFMEQLMVRGRGASKTIRPWEEAKNLFATSYLVRLLGEAEGNVSRAAELSGLGRQAIYQQLSKAGLNRSTFGDFSSDSPTP